MFQLIGKIARVFGEFKGKRRAARFALGSYIKTRKDIPMTGKFGINYLLPNISEPVAFNLYINGIYEIETHEFLLKMLPKNGVYFDIGANIGSIAIPLCKKRPDIRCVAVEASEWVHGYLTENIKRNNLEKSIIAVNEAMGDTAEGYVSFYTNQDFFGKGSMSPVYSDKPINVKRTTFQNLAERYNIEQIDVIKIDIEGFEYFAFKGGEKFLSADNAPLILFEFVDWAEEHAGLKGGESQKLLKSYGYSLYELALDGTLTKRETVLEKGSGMFVASKKSL